MKLDHLRARLREPKRPKRPKGKRKSAKKRVGFKALHEHGLEVGGIVPAKPGDLCTLCNLPIPELEEDHFFSGFTVCAKCVHEKIGA